MVQPPTSGKRRSPWLVAAAAIAAALVAIALVSVIAAFTWFDVSLNDGVGDRTYAPASAEEVRRVYKLGVGRLQLDLSRVSFDRELHVEARVGIGELRVVVPRRASVVVDARATAGSVAVLGHDDDGRNARVRVTGRGNLLLQARVGAGAVDVERDR